MGWQSIVLSLPIIVGFVVSIVILVYSVTVYRNRREDPLVVLYVLLVLAAIVWTGFSALKLLQTNADTKLLFYRLLHVGAASLPPLLFLFVLAFTDRTGWLRPDRVAAVFAVPAAFVLLLFFGPSDLVISGTEVTRGDLVILRVVDGPGFLVFSLYSALVVVATVAVVLIEARRVGEAYYPQAALIAVAILTPILFSLLTTAEIPPFVDGRVNLVPTSAPVSVVLLGVLLYRYRLVDLPPLAYATAMRYSPDALLVLDADERVVSTNEHGGELLATVDGVPGSPVVEAFPGFDPRSTSGELLDIEDDGETTYYRVFTEPLTRGGRRLGWVVVLRDETTQQRQQRRLQERSEQMELFASAISHDLRNPLSVASGQLQLAREEFERERLDKVETAHARMGEIIDELLPFARAGRGVEDPEPIAMRTVVETAWDNVTTATAELRVADARVITADPTMIQHVFENLFRNAVEHGSTSPQSQAPGDAVEHGSTSPQSQAPGDGFEYVAERLTVTVGTLDGGFYAEDDGAGIPAEERADVFEVGYTETGEGTGLGLSIVKQIVNAHGWDIRVTVSEDGGARFEITGVEEATLR